METYTLNRFKAEWNTSSDKTRAIVMRAMDRVNAVAVAFNINIDTDQGEGLALTTLDLILQNEIERAAKHQTSAANLFTYRGGSHVALLCGEHRLAMISIVRREEPAEPLAQVRCNVLTDGSTTYDVYIPGAEGSASVLMGVAGGFDAAHALADSINKNALWVQA